jgi:hypothetical protein
MRICLEKSTGKLVEMQSDPRQGTLIQNAINAGYAQVDVEEKEVTADEWATIREEWIDKPQRDEDKKHSDSRIVAEEIIRSRLGFTDDEWVMLKEVLQST